MPRIRIILFDIDKVLIRPPRYFSQELETRGYPQAKEILDKFFKGEDNDLCLKGKSSALEAIVPYLEKLGWKETPEEYFRQHFAFEKDFLDQELLSLVRQFQDQGIICYLATDQEKHRASFLLEDMNFRNIFDGYFISSHIGYTKNQEGFWTYAINELKNKFSDINPGEVAFFDDTQKNIEVAKRAGIKAFVFEDMYGFKNDLRSLGLYA